MDHPTSPVAWICTPTSPEPNQPIDDIANQNILWFLFFFGEVVFFAIFVHFGPQRPPSKGRTKKMGALGSLLRVPSPPPDPILSTKSQHHIFFLLGAYSCTCQDKDDNRSLRIRALKSRRSEVGGAKNSGAQISRAQVPALRISTPYHFTCEIK